ncbi:YihY/virulence factor BrkB family protein [Aeromicrobium sp. CTD01-1L150]|uniref:YihY/virulence factor BrkB family protein n=1 Tax=Aeromicrobium sp. CTD01-1L150 TaxID=3341830 RepID=UPI0035BF6403
MTPRRDPVPTVIAWVVAAVSAGYLALWQRRRQAQRPTEPVLDDVPREDEEPKGPTQLNGSSYKLAFSGAVAKFSKDQGTDLAAALTYYSVLALFPALIALVSLLGVFGQGASTVNAVLDVFGEFVPEDSLDTIRPVVESMAQSTAAGLGLFVGLLGALWSASGYVGAFGRAMNRIYGVEEGRPVWKLRPAMLLVTFVVVVLCALTALSLVLTGPVARAVGDVVGVGDEAVQVWGIAKWPVMLLIVVAIVAILYHATPNVQQPKFRWISIGAAFAVIVWIVASGLFGLYVSMAGNYSATYGSLAGVIVFLLWLWITNIALLLGAELDAEIERSRELQAGLRAEEDILLPPRDTSGIEKKAEKERERVAAARAVREQHEEV